MQMEWCRVMQWVNRNIMRWLGHTERMKSEEFVKKVYMCKFESLNGRGRPLGRRKDRGKEYMSDRGTGRGGGLEQARRECLDRKRWRLFRCDYPLG